MERDELSDSDQGLQRDFAVLYGSDHHYIRGGMAALKDRSAARHCASGRSVRRLRHHAFVGCRFAVPIFSAGKLKRLFVPALGGCLSSAGVYRTVYESWAVRASCHHVDRSDPGAGEGAFLRSAVSRRPGAGRLSDDSRDDRQFCRISRGQFLSEIQELLQPVQRRRCDRRYYAGRRRDAAGAWHGAEVYGD